MAGKTDKKLAAATAKVDKLTAEVKALRSRVKSLEAESESWKNKAKKQRSRVQKVRAKAEKAIAEATDAAKKRAKLKSKAGAREHVADHPRAEPLAMKNAPEAPQPSWTVARLREAARDQGVPGYSRLRKEQLLAALI